MQCPVCKKENEEGNHNCAHCGSRLTKRRNRRRDEEAEANEANADYRIAWLAYRCAALGLIPFLGLLLGPIALILGAIAWWQTRKHPWSKGLGPVGAALLLGFLITVTMWSGLALIVHTAYPGLWF
jgi:uncharacterized Tic20 family protein